MSSTLSAPTQNAEHALACAFPELFRKQAEEEPVNFDLNRDTPCSMGIPQYSTSDEKDMKKTYSPVDQSNIQSIECLAEHPSSLKQTNKQKSYIKTSPKQTQPHVLN